MRDAVRDNEAQGASHSPLHKQEFLTFYSRDDINPPSTTLSLSLNCTLLLSSKRNRAQRYTQAKQIQSPSKSQTINHNNEALSPCHHYPSACVRWNGSPSTSGLFLPIFKAHLFFRSVGRRWEPRGSANLDYRTNVLMMRLY